MTERPHKFRAAIHSARVEPIELGRRRDKGDRPALGSAGPKELIADIWESDEEIEAFLTDLRSSRDASMG